MGEVEAFIDIQSFKNQMNIQWPKTTGSSQVGVEEPWQET